MTPAPRSHVVAAAVALIVAPIVALLLKGSVYPGWMLLVILFAGLPLALGYILQVVIASVGMLRTRGVFNHAADAKRGLLAAWVTSVAVILTAFFLVDGGDDGTYGSAFTAITGTSSTAAGEQLSTAFMFAAAAVWVGGWLWLVVEWIVLVIRARSSRQ